MLNCKVKCIKAGTNSFTKNKIYQVINGTLIDNNSMPYEETTDLKELNSKLKSKFELYEEPQTTLDYWSNICKLNERQESKGKAKYGQILEENTTLSTSQRIEHLEEELLDGLKYCEHLKKAVIDSLSANDYQRMAMRTAGEYNSEYDCLRNAAYGLNGEAGEVIDLLKKHEFQGHELDREKLIDELGDVQWYIALAATAMGKTLEDIMQHNVDKLKKRYPEGFDKNRSINRDVPDIKTADVPDKNVGEIKRDCMKCKFLFLSEVNFPCNCCNHETHDKWEREQ